MITDGRGFFPFQGAFSEKITPCTASSCHLGSTTKSITLMPTNVTRLLCDESVSKKRFLVVCVVRSDWLRLASSRNS